MRVKKIKSKFVKAFMRMGFAPSVGYRVFRAITKKEDIYAAKEEIEKAIREGKYKYSTPPKVKVIGYTYKEDPTDIFETYIPEGIEIETPKGRFIVRPYGVRKI